MKVNRLMGKIQKLTIDKILQLGLNVALISLTIILCKLLGKEIVNLAHLAFFESGKSAHYELLESILMFFLYFEFIAMIVKYFQEDYHFPLRYFMYIGITAMIRLVVIDHEDAKQTLLYTASILVLVISYFLINLMHAKINK
ncbi:MAG: phosphate-starvation-inducible protein PsiE [Bacillales bacterium]|nr:phosphate-starvation-inducible protein PsiE [Bacillales bacterium]